MKLFEMMPVEKVHVLSDNVQDEVKEILLKQAERKYAWNNEETKANCAVISERLSYIKESGSMHYVEFGQGTDWIINRKTNGSYEIIEVDKDSLYGMFENFNTTTKQVLKTKLEEDARLVEQFLSFTMDRTIKEMQETLLNYLTISSVQIHEEGNAVEFKGKDADGKDISFWVERKEEQFSFMQCNTTLWMNYVLNFLVLPNQLNDWITNRLMKDEKLRLKFLLNASVSVS